MRVAKIMSAGLAVTGMLALFAGTGCSDRSATDQLPDAALSENLSAVQGEWICSCSNNVAKSCTVIIEGHTIRLRYQEKADSSVVRESASIERMDENLHVFILSGGSGAWPYLYGTTNGEEYLELEIFNRQQGSWKRLRLQRSEISRG